MTSFIAIDYETANSSYESVCAVGVSVVKNGVIDSNFYSLIKPDSEFNYFDPFNVGIHGIKSSDVKNAPKFIDVWPKIEELYSQESLPIACHYAGFDIRLTEAMMLYLEIPFKDIRFYDTCTISKKVWPELMNYKLNTISGYLNIDLQHHDAASDANACALVAIEHMKVLSLSNLSDVAKHFGYDLGHLHKDGLKRMSDFKYYPSSGSHSSTDYINSSKNVNATTEVDANGELFGKSIVFTGGLESMTRPNAIQRAVNNGASVTTGITKKTDYLIVGISDFLDFTKGIKTNKLKDAEALKAKGSSIAIIDEEEFLRMTH